MNWRKFERQLIKGGMIIILCMVIAMYFLMKQWMLTGAASEAGPPTLSTMYYAHKAELILWYDKFVIPFAAPAFFYWFHRFIDARYARREEANAENGANTDSSDTEG